MTISEFIGKFKSKMLWGNLLAMAGVIAVLLIGFKFAIDVYTHHGESITIPNLVHRSFDSASATADHMGLTLQVSDTGYVRTLPPGCILEQFPAAGEQVKAGHVIYVTINATQSPTITLPDVIDNCSLREAMARLKAMGFRLGPPAVYSGRERLGVRHLGEWPPCGLWRQDQRRRTGSSYRWATACAMPATPLTLSILTSRRTMVATSTSLKR